MNLANEIFPTRDKPIDIPRHLLYPLPTDGRFADGPRTVYLAQRAITRVAHGQDFVPRADYIDSDRLLEIVDPDLAETSERMAEAQTGTRDNAHFFELMLQGALNNSAIDLQHILAGVNRRTGNFSYRSFGYTIAPLRFR